MEEDSRILQSEYGDDYDDQVGSHSYIGVSSVCGVLMYVINVVYM